MNYIAWYFAIGMVFTLIFVGLLHKQLKKKDLPEIVAILIEDILFWPIKLFRTIRVVYDFILDIAMIAFNCLRDKSRGNS